MSGMEDHIVRARTLVRRGDFITAACDQRLMAALKAIPQAHKPAFNERWLMSRALLAEINDQTGAYERVSEIFGDEHTVKAVHRSLLRFKERHEQAPRTTPVPESDRRMFRAQMFFVLQAAIHKLRRFELDGAAQWMADCQASADAISSNQCRLYGPSSLLHYWQGRMEMARNQMDDARKHFYYSMRQTERNLAFHYADASSRLEPGNERIAYAVYSLASCMAFGVAHINHRSGHLARALDLLRPASAILMGTSDNYRRGYVYMLIGAAERGQAGREPKQLDRAIKSLEISSQLFAGDAAHQLRHPLHQARVQYQMGLAFVYLAQAFQSHSLEHDRHVESALLHHDRSSSILYEFESADFRDPELRYDLWILKSRLLRERAQFDLATIAANNAFQIAKRWFPYAPVSSQAKALITKAEVLLARVEHGHTSEATKRELLAAAEAQLTGAFAVADSNWGVTTTILLYQAQILVRRKQMERARQKFHEAWDKGEKHIENGWTRQLAMQVERAVSQPSAEIAQNLDQIKAYVALENPDCSSVWHETLERVRDRMIEWAEQRNPRHPWIELGIGKATWYNYKQKPGRKR